MKNVYVVVRTGVYDRGIIGGFSSSKLAKDAITEAKKQEDDDYHKFEIRTYKLNEIHNVKDFLDVY
jgi:hypothetical protein